VAAAHRLTFAGERVEELPVEGDRIRIEMGAYEWLEVEGRWNSPRLFTRDTIRQ
jgi:hypothetical protein